jgi:hypothetical protein
LATGFRGEAAASDQRERGAAASRISSTSSDNDEDKVE